MWSRNPSSSATFPEHPSAAGIPWIRVTFAGLLKHLSTQSRVFKRPGGQQDRPSGSVCLSAYYQTPLYHSCWKGKVPSVGGIGPGPHGIWWEIALPKLSRAQSWHQNQKPLPQHDWLPVHLSIGLPDPLKLLPLYVRPPDSSLDPLLSALAMGANCSHQSGTCCPFVSPSSFPDPRPHIWGLSPISVPLSHSDRAEH